MLRSMWAVSVILVTEDQTAAFRNAHPPKTHLVIMIVEVLKVLILTDDRNRRGVRRRSWSRLFREGKL